MRRRDFLTLIAGAAALRPFEAGAQKASKAYRVGILETISAARNSANLDALREGFRLAGFVEGQNLSIEYRSADGHEERYDELASELVRLNVDVIVTRGTPAVQAAQRATNKTPIIMAGIGAPLIVVDSLRRPGGNVTGMSTFSEELIGKRVELLKELVPNLSRLALIHNIGNPMSPPEWERTKAAANSLSLGAVLFDVRNEEDLRRAFELAVQERVGGIVVGGDGLTQTHMQMIVDLAADKALPATHPSRDFVEAGGLMSYAVSYPDLYLRAAGMVDKVLKGTAPADIPVEQPTKLEFVINLKTARSLGIVVPPSIFLRVDKMIE